MQNVDISEIYNHDIFVATKVSFNDTGSSEVKFGVLYDTKDDESILKLEAKSRIKDEFVLSAEVLHILDDFSLYPQLGSHTRLKFGVYYYF
jgi:ferredoxin-fold anticodon binding domain-containing protein